MNDLKFDKNRRKAKYCPCNKSNKDGKFAPYVGYFDKGYCHSCGNTFLPDSENSTIVKPFVAEPLKPISYHDNQLVSQSLKAYKSNNFILFLNSIFAPDEVSTAIKKYKIGTSKHYSGATIFWQIDDNQNVRHGKIMLYDPITGKKTKFNSVRSVLKLEGFNLKQCLFGLHLLTDVTQNIVALVESEKTAVLMSVFKPQYTWMATGGLSEFKLDKLKPLKAFNLVAFPDKGKLKNWNDKAIEFKKYGYNISVNDWLEKQNLPDETDFADVLILAKKSQPTTPKFNKPENNINDERIDAITKRIKAVRRDIDRTTTEAQRLETVFREVAENCKIEWFRNNWMKYPVQNKVSELMYWCS